MEILTAIFGSETKVKLMRLFLFNPETPFLVKEMAYRTRSSTRVVGKDISALLKADLVKKRRVVKGIELLRGKRVLTRKVRGLGYLLNEKFAYLDQLKSLLTIASLHADETLAKRFTNCGKIKLFIASGVFIQNWEARVDLLIVGDELNLTRIETVIKSIESEIGKEIAYSAFETSDFEYRLGIHDRLVRDILDYPHMTLLDRMGIEPQ